MRILIILVAIAAVGCHGKKELRTAKSSLYDTDFAIVYNAALDATRKVYPTLSDSPGPGLIKTAWHSVAFANNEDDLANQHTIAAGQGYNPNSSTTQAQQSAGMPTRLAYKRYFIRFDVSVVGGRPWKVKIIGHASEWEPGNALPTELHGPARPHWLDGRTDALTLAIYQKIKPYAVPMKKDEEPKKPEDLVEKTDPKAFSNVPAAAAPALAKLRDVLVRRDYATLRTLIADDVAWSLGGAPGADTAMAMWQADAEPFEAMQRILATGAGCVGAEKKVVCPPTAEPVRGTYQLVLELRGDAWKVTSFLKAE